MEPMTLALYTGDPELDAGELIAGTVVPVELYAHPDTPLDVRLPHTELRTPPGYTGPVGAVVLRGPDGTPGVVWPVNLTAVAALRNGHAITLGGKLPINIITN